MHCNIAGSSCGTSVMAIVLFASVACGSEVLGQATAQPGEVRHRNECRLARQILVQGQPANKLDWALQKVQECDAVQETIAEALDQHRYDQEQTLELELLVGLTTRVVDAGIFARALEISADPSAGLIGRLQAMRVVFNQFTPLHLIDFEGFVAGGGFYSLPSTGEPLVITPLPSDAGEQVLAALGHVPEEPNVDRRVARIALGLQAVAQAEIQLRDEEP